MLELAVLGSFCACLMALVALGAPVLVPLTIGFLMFCGYGIARGHSVRDVLGMALDGISGARGVLESFMLIGILTALWRAAGTISEVVLLATPFVTPAMAPLAVFLLTGAMSFLMGTAFGTAATMGVVCMTIATSMGASSLLCGGAVLAGSYFGDRCSPMSSSALLVRSVTHTTLGQNLRSMMRSALVPLAVTLLIYGLAGLALAPAGGAAASGTTAALVGYFDQGVVALLPVVPVLVLPLARVGMKRTMAASIAIAALVSVLARGVAPADLVWSAVAGYVPAGAGTVVRSLMSGGGIVSMLNASAIVCLSSSFSGLFMGTGLLDGIRGHVAGLAERVTPFAAVLAVAVPASMIACNQTLGTMLANDLCSGLEPTSDSLALDLEDSAVVVSPLVPWSTACAAVVTMCGAPEMCWATAVYLWLIPLWHLAATLAARHGSRASRGVARLALGPRGVATA